MLSTAGRETRHEKGEIKVVHRIARNDLIMLDCTIPANEHAWEL